ncbi:MAG: hypothetical protein K8H74_17840 [Notoacmeibacter sp.]|nr:hypothetical protein [Notoacmeibacter sp.]
MGVIDRTGRALLALETELAGKRIEWGVDDCSAVVARFLREAHGVTPDLPVWHSREEAEALIADAGSLEALWERCLGPASPGDPERGSVGVIDAARYGHVGMICAGAGYWGWRADGGWTWRTPYPKNIVAQWSFTS